MAKKKIAISLGRALLEDIDAAAESRGISRSRHMETLLRRGMEAEGAGKVVILLRKEHHRAALLGYKGSTLLSAQADFFRRNGISDVCVLTQRGPRLTELEMECSAAGMKVILTGRSGNAEALREMSGELSGDFVVMSGDVYNDFDLKKMIERHKQRNSIATMGLMSRAESSQYGNAILDGDMITNFQEKPRKAVSNIVNAGIYVFKPAVFAALKDCASLERDLFPALAKDGQLAGYFTMGEYFHAQEAR